MAMQFRRTVGAQSYEAIVFAFNNCGNPVWNLNEYSLSEMDCLPLIVPCQHNVRRLHVAMRYTGTMRAVESIANLRGVRKRLLKRNRTFFNARRLRLTLHQLHHHVADSVLRADVEQRANIRMKWVSL